jgi:hypothetical protein
MSLRPLGILLALGLAGGCGGPTEMNPKPAPAGEKEERRRVRGPRRLSATPSLAARHARRALGLTSLLRASSPTQLTVRGST